MILKKCNCCLSEKSIELFVKDSDRKDGYKNICKDCKYKKYKSDDSQLRKEQKKEWNKNNKDKLKKAFDKWKTDKPQEYKDKLKRDNIKYRLENNIRSRILSAFKNNSISKNTKSAMLTGMSSFELKNYLLSMGYDKNIHHIDHIIPLSLFDLTIHEHQLIACNYLNLQPLLVKDNLSKNNNLINSWQDKIKEICNHLNIDHAPVIDHINQYI